MAVGVGGLLMDIMNPSAKMGQALAGPSPNPQPLAGGAPGPNDGSGAIPAGATAQAPQNGPQQAPAQTYAPDPTNASTIDKLMSLYQNEARANDINRNIALMGSAFGTAQQQHDAMTAISGMPQGGGGVLQALSEAQGIQRQQLANEEASRFQAGASTLLRGLGYTQDQAATIGNNPELTQKLVAQDFINKSPTEQEKLLNRFRSDMQAQGKSPAEILQMETGLLGGMVAGGNDIGQLQYRQEASMAASAGKPFPDYPTWQAQHTAAAGAMSDQAKAIQDFKTSGTEEFSTVDQKLKKSETTVDALLKNMDATRTALSDPEFMTTGKFAANAPSWMTASLEVKAAAANINTLKNELSASGLSGVKNVRNVKEFNTIAGSLTAALDPNNPNLEGALQDIKTRFDTAHAQALAAAGKPIPYKYKDVVDPTYLNKNSPWFTGSELQAPSKDGEPAPSNLAPVAAIEHLKAHPDLAPQFDAKYGPGASKKVLGQ